MRPHVGEWVRFRRRVPVGVVRALAGEEGGLEEVVAALGRQIVDWNWAGWPRPGEEGFEEALWELDVYEFAWLQEHLLDAAQLSDELKLRIACFAREGGAPPWILAEAMLCEQHHGWPDVGGLAEQDAARLLLHSAARGIARVVEKRQQKGQLSAGEAQLFKEVLELDLRAKKGE